MVEAEAEAAAVVAMVAVVLLGRFSVWAQDGVVAEEVVGAVEADRHGVYWPCCFRGVLCLLAVGAGEEEHVEEEVEAVVG
jgi:hypothetical protein